MAGLGTLATLARTVVRERSRPGRLGVPVAILGVALTVRHLANAYLAVLTGSSMNADAGAGYLTGSLLAIALWAASVGAARACRTTTVLLDHPRFRATPLPRARIRRVAALWAVARPATLHLALLALTTYIVSVLLWGWSGALAVEALLLLAGGGAAALLSYLALRAARLGAHAAEYLEILALLLLVMANPGVEVVDGRLETVLLGAGLSLPKTLPGQGVVLALIPAALGALALATRTGRAIRARWTRAHPAATRSRNPFHRLYRAALPVPLLVFTYVVEIPLILGSAMSRAELLRLSLALLALRVGWYLVWLGRTDGRLAGRRPAPRLTERALMIRLLTSSPIHALLCAAPPALLLLSR